MRFTTQHATEVTFDGQLYKQINGLRMGSSCSNICSDVVIEDILDKTFRTIPKPALFAKYIDDIICLTTEDTAAKILESLNSQNPRIQFEMEVEQLLEDGTNTGSINFLDVTLYNHHDLTPISSKWYQKAIASGRLLNYLSCHKPQTIYNTAKSFVINMHNVTSTHFLNNIRTLARTLLTHNNYPIQIIDKIFAEVDHPSSPVTHSQQQQWFNSIHNDNDIFHINDPFTLPDAIQNTDFPISHAAPSSIPKPTQSYARLALPYVPQITEEVTEIFNTFRPDITIPTKPANPMKQLYNAQKNPKRQLETETAAEKVQPEPLLKRRR